jgi:hypothetical protein
MSDEKIIWEEVWRYLRLNLDALSEPASRKLSALPVNLKGKLCATCLAIDLASGALTSKQLLEVFENLEDKYDDICTSISNTLSRPQYDNLRCCSLLESPPLDIRDGYVTVMEIGTFIKKFVSPNTGDGLSPEEINRVLDLYFDEDGDLSALVKCNLGESKRLWVLPRSEYDVLLRRATGESFRVFLDALGLTFKSGFGPMGVPFLIAIFYPSEHDCRAKQPTSFDVYWANAHVQFVSFRREDGWGRTQSFSGSRYFDDREEGMPRERVHGDSSGLLGFRGRIMGGAYPVEDISQHETLRAALERFVRLRSSAL